LRGALARTICPSRRDDDQVRALAKMIDERLQRTPVPGRKPHGFAQRAKTIGRALLPHRVRFRQLPPHHAIGPSFADHLTEWVGQVTHSPEIVDALNRIDCPEHDTHPDALARRFPTEFERELFSAEDPGDIRQRLAGDLLVHQASRGERPLTPRERVMLTVTTLLVSGGAGAGVAAAADASEATTIGVTAGAVFLGAVAGVVRGARVYRPDRDQAAARMSVRRWLAQVLCDITGRPWKDRSDSLRAGLIYALSQLNEGHEFGLSDELDSRYLRDKYLPLAAQARDSNLEDALTGVDYALVDAERDPNLRPQVLVRLLELVDACETPEENL
jgi:hypothetical protein